MRKNVRAAMDALFAGKEYTNASVQTRQTGEYATHGTHPTVYSYGSHFPLVFLCKENNAAYVNTTKSSVTTSTQQSGVAVYLYYEGYENTGETVTHRGHTYAVYSKDHPERWPDYSHLPGMSAWHANNSTYKRPAHHTTEATR